MPDLTKPFTLYVEERAGVTRGVLTQTLGLWKRPVAYLSKKLDPVASGWFSCLKAIAAIALLVKDANKLTLGQQITVVAPHTLESIIWKPPDWWMTTNAPVTHYQSFLLTERVTFAPPAVLNLTTAWDFTYSSLCWHSGRRNSYSKWSEGSDQPWPESLSWYTDGSSLEVKGKRKAGTAVQWWTESKWSRPAASLKGLQPRKLNLWL